MKVSINIEKINFNTQYYPPVIEVYLKVDAIENSNYILVLGMVFLHHNFKYWSSINVPKHGQIVRKLTIDETSFLELVENQKQLTLNLTISIEASLTLMATSMGSITDRSDHTITEDELRNGKNKNNKISLLN
ncbi:MAG: hypothetical protein ACPKPY_06215 [Nitrososphaeraceae archaeon]